MPNKNYLKGTRYERSLVNSARKAGKIAFRSAGSHSMFDVVIIDLAKRAIEFDQCKTGNAISEKEEAEMKDKFRRFSGMFKVDFEVKVKR